MNLLEAFKKYHNANHHDGDNHFDDEVYKMSNGDDFDNDFVQECFDHFEAGWEAQQKRIDELKQEVKKWKAQSIMSVIHGTCDCGEPWQVVVSNKEGFNQLHCFACGKDRYENKDFFGEESALKGGDKCE